MASEYYKWLARDVRPEEEKVLTREEKWRNWWYYHKWHVIIGILCLIFMANIGHDMLYNARNKPDYKIAYVGKTALPEDTVEALELAFATLGEDLNGNGKVQVELLSYELLDEEASGPSMDENSAERGYNASMMLLMNIETVESMIFLLEDPASFSANYPVLTRVDGTKIEDTPDSDVPTCYRWADCPVLAGLELGTFEIPLVGEMAVGDSQLAMANIYVARRGLWDDDSNDTIEGALRLWETMTEGAK